MGYAIEKTIYVCVTRGFTTFAMVILFKFPQNLVKYIVNLDAYWCSDYIYIYIYSL